jgi:hypothetical protein
MHFPIKLATSISPSNAIFLSTAAFGKETSLMPYFLFQILGTLAGWFRMKYPHLVIGSVATSAPVFALVNFKSK